MYSSVVAPEGRPARSVRNTELGRDHGIGPVRGDGYPGSSARLAAGLATDSKPVTSACSLMRQNLQRLLDHGYSAGVMRDDIDAQELLIMVSAVAGTVGASPRQFRFVNVILSGLIPE